MTATPHAEAANASGGQRRYWLPRATLALAAAALALQAPTLVGWVANHPYFAIAGIEFPYERIGRRAAAAIGQVRIPPEELAAWAGVAPGTSLFSIRARSLQRRLEEHPWVRRAAVQVQPPRRVLVRVAQRRPIAIARLDDLYYVDRRGVLITPVGPHDSRDMPIITGLEPGFGPTSPDIALPRIAALLRRHEGRGWLGAISEVHLDLEHGATVYPVAERMVVKLGWGGWYSKLALGERVMQARLGEMAPAALIDLSQGTSVVVRESAAPAGTPTPVSRTEV